MLQLLKCYPRSAVTTLHGLSVTVPTCSLLLVGWRVQEMESRSDRHETLSKEVTEKLTGEKWNGYTGDEVQLRSQDNGEGISLVGRCKSVLTHDKCPSVTSADSNPLRVRLSLSTRGTLRRRPDRRKVDGRSKTGNIPRDTFRLKWWKTTYLFEVHL